MTQTVTRKLGVPGIVSMVITVAANCPIILGVFGSVGAPLMMLVATAIMLLEKRGADAGVLSMIDLRRPEPSRT